jgi:hypothetical protein
MPDFPELRYLLLDPPTITATNGLETAELTPVTIGVRWYLPTAR